MKNILKFLLILLIFLSCTNELEEASADIRTHNFVDDEKNINTNVFIPSPGLYGPANVQSRRRYTYTLIPRSTMLKYIDTGSYFLWIQERKNLDEWETIYYHYPQKNSVTLIFPDINQTKQYRLIYKLENLFGTAQHIEYKTVTVD